MLFKEAFNVAANSPNNVLGGDGATAGGTSAWPMIAFLSFIFATPYLIMKMVGRPDTAKMDEAKNPRTWSQPIASQAIHSFQATNAQELSISAGEVVYVAPKEIQNMFRLMNTGWAIATKDFNNSGMIPINYLQRHAAPQQNISAMPSVNLQPDTLNRAPVMVEAVRGGGVDNETLIENN